MMSIKPIKNWWKDKALLRRPHSFRHFLYLLCASAGASAAIVIDTMTSQSHNNIFTQISTLYTYLSNPFTFGFFTKTMLSVLIACGASTIYYFKPTSPKAAFAYGFGTLASLALFT